MSQEPIDKRKQRNEYYKKWYKNNRENCLINMKIYRMKNKERKKEMDRLYRNKNKKHLSEISKIYRKKNRDIISQKNKDRYNKQKPFILKKLKIYREKFHFDGNRELVLKRERHKCRLCHKKYDDSYLCVHHIDLKGRGSKIKNNLPNNLTTLCKKCHARLHNILRYKKVNILSPY